MTSTSARKKTQKARELQRETQVEEQALWLRESRPCSGESLSLLVQSQLASHSSSNPGRTPLQGLQHRLSMRPVQEMPPM